MITPSDERPEVVQHAEQAYEAIRAINHLTRSAYPAPVVYEVLGELKGLGLPQACRQLADGLQRSLSEYDVYEDDGSDPTRSVDVAQGYLNDAAALASQVGELLAKAQNAINRQGYRTGDPS